MLNPKFKRAIRPMQVWCGYGKFYVVVLSVTDKHVRYMHTRLRNDFAKGKVNIEKFRQNYTYSH